MVPNRVLRSKILDNHDKVIFALIASCGAHDTDNAFPSYPKLMEWSGQSRDRVWKSLRHLEKGGLIRRYKQGRKVLYRTWWNSPPDGPINSQPVRYTDYTSPPDGLEPVRQTDPIKIQDKESLINGINSPSVVEKLSLAELVQMAKERALR